MGRKIELGELTEEEEKEILDVIKRDYTVRKVETERIGKLSEDVKKEKQNEVVKEVVQGEVPINSLCAKCGSKFIWLINPKTQCSGCDLYFCKNKIDCIVYDKITEKCFCNSCLKQRDLHAYSGDWFYSKLKGKFRRHGGAKVSRELQKKNKPIGSERDTSPAPTKPQRLGLNDTKHVSPSSSVSSTPVSVRRQPSDTNQSEISRTSKEEVPERIGSNEINIQQVYDAQMDAVVIGTSFEMAPPPQSDIEIQTDDLETIDDKLLEIKEELEAVISKILLPKLDELKRSQMEHQTEVDRQQKVEDAVGLAEEMIDEALERALEKHNQRPPEENILLAKYLSDSKTELMNLVSTQLHDESSFQPNSARWSSLREAGTMTETSDSEMESNSSASGRKRSPKGIPLSERLGNLSPYSLRRTLDQSPNSSRSSITQGVVLQKDQLVARADIDNALEQILDEQGVILNGPNSPQEFSTELKFTAVGGGRRRFPSGEISDDSDEKEEPETPQNFLSNSDNWPMPDLQMRPSHFGKASNVNSSNSMMSLQIHEKSPYENLSHDGSDSDDDREHVQEEQVLASVVRRPNGPMSPQALMSLQVEVVESLPEKKTHLPVEVAVHSSIIESMSEDLNVKNHRTPKILSPKSPPVTEELILAVDRHAKQSQAPPQEEAAETLFEDQLGVKYDSDQETHETSDSSSSNISRGRNSFLQPQRDTASQEQKIPASKLSYDDDLIADRDDFGDRIAELLAQRQLESYEPKQQDVSVQPPFNVRESISIVNDEGSSRKAEEQDSSSEEESQTSKPEENQPGVDKSVVGMRMVNGKSLEIISDDVLQKIEDEKMSQTSDSESDSSKTCSIHSSVEDIHKMSKAEEAIYKNAAQTYVMEKRLDQFEEVATGLSRSDPGLKQRLNNLDVEIDEAEKEVEEIKHEGKSIDAIMQELRGAGLKAERGGFKRTSLDSQTSDRKQENKPPPSRHSLPPTTQSQRPVNATESNRPSWLRNTFTVIPGTRIAPPPDEPVFHSTPKQHRSSSESSATSDSTTPTRPRSSIIRSKSLQEENTGEPNELQDHSNDGPTDMFNERRKFFEDKVHSAMSRTLASSADHSEDEELCQISYQTGLTAQELEESRIPTPVPRKKKKNLQIEETVVIIAPEPKEKIHNHNSDHQETAKEILPAKDVRRMVDRFERRKSSSSSSSDESGTEYTEPLIGERMKIDPLIQDEMRLDEEKRKMAASQNPLVHDPTRTESDVFEHEDTKVAKTRSKILKDDSWMKRRESNSDSESGTSSSSNSSEGTALSSRSGVFDNLSAAEQREMARIALLHCQETAIAEERFQTKKITVVKTSEVKSTPLHPQKEVTPTVQVSSSARENIIQQQQEILPTLAPHDIRTVAEVRFERLSSSSSSSSEGSVKRKTLTGTAPPKGIRSPVAPRRTKHDEDRKGTSNNTESDRVKLRQSYNGTMPVIIIEKSPDSRNTLQVLDSPRDLDRGQGFRGSITMRGGKMMMTSSPDSGPEFQGSPN